MIKSSGQDFGQIMRPIFLKARQTLIHLLQEISQEEVGHQYCSKYSTVCFENTLKLLLRCKL
jgi:hypothetical protein